MVILLTGATGFIGGHLRAALMDHHRVIALTRQAALTEEDPRYWRHTDLSRPDFELSILDKVDAVVALAQSRAYRDFPERSRDIYQVNVHANMLLLEWARRTGCKRFLLTSSANVYRLSPSAITEDSVLEPASFYARSKRMSELVVETYGALMRCVVFRLFTVYGPGQRDSLIPSLMARIRAGKPVEVQGRRGLRLSPVYVTDVCAAIRAALEAQSDAPGYDLFNLGGSETVGIQDLGLSIGEALGIEPRFEYLAGEEPNGWVADSSRANARLGWKPVVPLKEGIENTARASEGTPDAD